MFIILLLLFGIFLLLVHESGLFEWQMSMNTQSVASKLNSSGLLRTQGLIGGKWSDAYDGKTIQVYLMFFFSLLLPMFFCKVQWKRGSMYLRLRGLLMLLIIVV